MYDVAIIGAGPAGATLARLIADRYRVLLVDKRNAAGSPENTMSGKCCGGLLAPDAQAALSKMGLGLPKSVLAEPQLFVVRAIDIPQCLERYYQRYYINSEGGHICEIRPAQEEAQRSRVQIRQDRPERGRLHLATNEDATTVHRHKWHRAAG